MLTHSSEKNTQDHYTNGRWMRVGDDFYRWICNETFCRRKSNFLVVLVLYWAYIAFLCYVYVFS